ncbi:uncharacterized protein PRCAT00001433001 [Priceomyces carsonii]|uniref:uncharacterized protein n=1 Tax=Priceomyces carsonii TaxID=28549 RepID=UPI002ED884A9|nr:unnamed protein product [Priceomyces carsonii]
MLLLKNITNTYCINIYFFVLYGDSITKRGNDSFPMKNTEMIMSKVSFHNKMTNLNSLNVTLKTGTKKTRHLDKKI